MTSVMHEINKWHLNYEKMVTQGYSSSGKTYETCTFDPKGRVANQGFN